MADMLCEANEYLDDQEKTPDPPSSENSTEESDMAEGEATNEGILAIEAACASVNIRYPQDVSLLNEARKNWSG